MPRTSKTAEEMEIDTKTAAKKKNQLEITTSSSSDDYDYDDDDDDDDDPQPKELALLALEYYNEAARISRGPEYRFVRDRCCHGFFNNREMTIWHHLNFIARPVSETEDQEFTFFAETKNVLGANPRVMKCQIVGSTKVTPRLDGCIGCEMSDCRDLMVHPITGMHCRGFY